MAYGFIALNDDDEVVINDTNPTYSKVRTGTLSGTTNWENLNAISTYGFQLTGNAALSADELIIFSLNVNSWICGIPTSGYPFISNQSSLGYTVFKPRDRIAAPSGYGMAVFNSSGDCMWDSTSIVSRVVNAGVVAGSSFSSSGYTSSTFTGGNGFYSLGGSLYVEFTSSLDARMKGQVVQRTGATSFRVTQKTVYQSVSSWVGSVAFSAQIAPVGLTYLSGYV